MSGFKEREAGWEKKIELDADFRFKVMIRRDKHLGRWAAEQMSIPVDEIDEYVSSVVRADLEEAGDDDVVRKIMADFNGKGVGISEDAVRVELKRLEQVAAEELHKKA